MTLGQLRLEKKQGVQQPSTRPSNLVQSELGLMAAQEEKPRGKRAFPKPGNSSAPIINRKPSRINEGSMIWTESGISGLVEDPDTISSFAPLNRRYTAGLRPPDCLGVGLQDRRKDGDEYRLRSSRKMVETLGQGLIPLSEASDENVMEPVLNTIQEGATYVRAYGARPISHS